MQPLVDVVDTELQVISKQDIKRIFGNAKEISELSNQMRAALRGCLDEFEAKQRKESSEETSVQATIKDLERLTVNRRSSTPVSISTSSPAIAATPKISKILLYYLPHLSLYIPYITSFPSIPSILTTLFQTNPSFTHFILTQESHPLCSNLKLSHWLLTIVQRIPRWTMLIDSLGKVMDDKMERDKLKEAWALAGKITENINTRLREQTDMLTLVNLQKAFYGLPRALVTPARRLIKKGEL